jgi:hypothetical protein
MDNQRFSTKIKDGSGSSYPIKQKWISNPSKECPKCNHVIDNNDVRVVLCYYFEVELGLLQYFHFSLYDISISL